MNLKQFFIIILVLYESGQLTTLAQENDLDFFLKQGLAHSPVLIDIGNQINSGSVDSLIIKARKKPQISYNGSVYYAPIINGRGYAEPITNISDVSSVVYASQRIFNQKTISAEYARFGIQNQALRISSKITEKDLRKAITLQYLTAYAISNDLTLNKELLTSSKDEESILRQLVEKGIYRQVDYYSFLVELKALELLLGDLQIQYRKELSSLYILCGLPDTSHIRLKLPEITLYPQINKENSPFFIRFAIDSLKIRNEKLLVDRNYKPAINWFSDAGLVNNFPSELLRNFGFSVGMSLSLPIYDGNQRKLNYEKLKIAENTRINYAMYFATQFNQQLQQLYEELKKTKDAIPQITQQLDFAEAVIRQDKDLLNTGNISVTDYVMALRNYITIRRNLNQYKLRTLQIITEINYWNQ